MLKLTVGACNKYVHIIMVKGYRLAVSVQVNIN